MVFVIAVKRFPLSNIVVIIWAIYNTIKHSLHELSEHSSTQFSLFSNPYLENMFNKSVRC